MKKSLLIKDEEDLINISIYYKIKKNKFGFTNFKILKDEEGKKLLEKNDDTVGVLNTKWACPSWKISNRITRSSTYYNPADGMQRVDITKYRENVFKTCLREWDVEENGEVVPINEETIGQLPNSIAEELLSRYDKVSLPDEEEEKKSQTQL